MRADAIRAFCRGLPHVTEDIKWEDDLVFSVGGKMFAVVMLVPPHRVSFKVAAEDFAELTERDGIIPAPYLARASWVSLERGAEIMGARELQQRLRDSYELVKARLPKKRRDALR